MTPSCLRTAESWLLFSASSRFLRQHLSCWLKELSLQDDDSDDDDDFKPAPRSRAAAVLSDDSDEDSKDEEKNDAPQEQQKTSKPRGRKFNAVEEKPAMPAITGKSQNQGATILVHSSKSPLSLHREFMSHSHQSLKD